MSRLPTRSAPGPSQVTYSFLKHAPPTAKLILLEGLSALLEPEGHRVSEHTEFFKQAFITLLVKDAAKSPDSMNSRDSMINPRPISLDTIKRLVGRIITDRVSKAAEARAFTQIFTSDFAITTAQKWSLLACMLHSTKHGPDAAVQ